MRWTERPILAWLAAVAVAAAVFALWPGLDRSASAVFYRGGAFPLADVALLNLLREGLWDLSIATFLVALLLAVRTLWRGPLAGIGARVWIFVALLYLLGPGLLVNGLLKNNWGRARPAQVTDFGGQAAFTPFWQITDQCDKNCSFVSGEGSASVALAISVFVIVAALRPPLPAGLAGTLRSLAVLAAVLGLFQRLATGRHFLSDTVFAALFVAGIALVLDRLLLRRKG